MKKHRFVEEFNLDNDEGVLYLNLEGDFIDAVKDYLRSPDNNLRLDITGIAHSLMDALFKELHV